MRESVTPEREPAARLAAAPRLRFDRVALRLIAEVQGRCAPLLGDGEALIVTVTAPIRQPRRTIEAIEDRVRNAPAGGEIAETLHGNGVRIRRLKAVAQGAGSVLVFVHNPETTAQVILDVTETLLRGAPATAAPEHFREGWRRNFRHVPSGIEKLALPGGRAAGPRS